MTQFIYAVLALGACYVIACRIDKMLKGVTQPVVFWQHALLAVAVFGSLLLSFTAWAEWTASALCAGVLAFFVLSLPRWRDSAPAGTEKKLTEIPAEQLRHVVGGTKR
jgi:hypothetical protein